ncbi:unnamed protein product [Closterium sp. Naga37s-1]|nr:unnamed protein product [Closterium sp. Naga37s-1]
MAVFAVRHAAAAGENAHLLKKSPFGKARRATCTAAPPEAALFALRLAVLLLVLSSASRFPTSAAAAPAAAAAAAAVPVLTVPMNVSAGEGLLHSESLLCCILGCGPTLSLVLALPLLPFSGHTLMPVRPPSPPLPSPSPPSPSLPSSSLPSFVFPVFPSSPPSSHFLQSPCCCSCRTRSSSCNTTGRAFETSQMPVLLQLQNTLELVQYNWAGAGDCALAAERGEAESGEETAGEPGGATGAAAAVGGAAEPLFPLRGKAAAGGVGRAGWAGVACDARGNPVRMEFPQQGLTGYLPLDVSKLTSLTKMDLSSNFLFGGIQPSITAAFPRLTALLLSSNRLTGRVPSRLPPLLSILSLSSNYLSGSLPRTSLLCSPASFSLNCFSKEDLFSCFASRTSHPGSAGPRLGSAVPDLASLVEQQRPEQQCGEALCGGTSGRGEYCEGNGVCRPMILSPALKYGDVLPWMCACHDGEVGRCGPQLLRKRCPSISPCPKHAVCIPFVPSPLGYQCHIIAKNDWCCLCDRESWLGSMLASKAGVSSFHVPLAEVEVVQSLCEGEVTTCDATSAANPVISPASVACVSEEEAEVEVERVVAALRAIAEARITVARGTIPPGAGARLPAAGARPPVVAGAPPPPVAGALPRTGAAEADLPRASAALLLGPRVVTSECSRASENRLSAQFSFYGGRRYALPVPLFTSFSLFSIPYCPLLPRPSPPPTHSPPFPLLSPSFPSHACVSIPSRFSPSSPLRKRLVPHPSTLPCTLHIYLPP